MLNFYLTSHSNFLVGESNLCLVKTKSYLSDTVRALQAKANLRLELQS